jgi:NADPH-dependent curcumin reductase CurA
MAVAHQWILAHRPAGLPTRDDFRFVETPLPALAPNHVLIKTIYLSVDPYMRPRMRNIKSYIPSFEINDVIECDAAGEVIESRHPDFSPGDFVIGRLGWQDYAVANGNGLRKLPKDRSQLPTFLGVLGMTGLTAYFALLDVGRPEPGQTVLVSGAAGAVGSIVGQIAKIKGARAVGIAGSDEKVRYLTGECGFDAAVNYKASVPLRKALKDACPNGVDVYFDNVGGPISDAAITLLGMRARVVICGQISLYNDEEPPVGPRLNSYFLVKRARLEGFLVHDYVHRAEEGRRELAAWLKAGKLKSRETIVRGLENTPEAFLGLFRGDNIGKQLVNLS